MEAPQASDAEIAADICIAVEYGNREGVLEALRRHKDSKGLEDSALQELVDMVMEAE
jgi:hypothetical protein